MNKKKRKQVKMLLIISVIASVLLIVVGSIFIAYSLYQMFTVMGEIICL